LEPNTTDGLDGVGSPTLGKWPLEERHLVPYWDLGCS
jgi:hypothetical protein